MDVSAPIATARAGSGVATADALSRFSGSLLGTEAGVTVRLGGEIDVASAPHLRSLLDDAISAGRPRVDVDVSDIEFMDAQGLAALADAAGRAAAAGSYLRVHGVSPWIFLLFEISGLTEALGVTRPKVDSALIRVLAAAAAIPLTKDVLNASLESLARMAHSVVAGADGVSITLEREGRFVTAAASDETVLQMDHDQYDTGEGPCLDAATEGERFYIESLSGEKRWPSFVPRAQARGIQTILSTPIMRSSAPVGALNVYSRRAGALESHEREWTDKFAAEAAAVLTSAQLPTSADALSGEIQQALLSREVIAIAQGVVVQRDGVSPATAHESLTAISRRTRRPLRDVCEELVRSADAGAPNRDPSGGGDHGQPAG